MERRTNIRSFLYYFKIEEKTAGAEISFYFRGRWVLPFVCILGDSNAIVSTLSDFFFYCHDYTLQHFFSEFSSAACIPLLGFFRVE